MTITPIAFLSDRHSHGSTGEMLVNVVVVGPGDVLTPCIPASVRRFGLRLKKPKYSCGWWQGRGRNAVSQGVEPSETVTTHGPPCTPEDEAWVDRSWKTLRNWMAENEE